MATYYKYAERNAANQVDWSAIGKSISDTLSDEVKRREQAKKDIEDASNEYAETLANAPMGESRDFNEWTLDFANNAQEFRLMQDRMLRSGRMKLRDYNMGRQNLKSGTEQAFNLANQYNAEYADKMKRLQNGESQDLEGFLMGTAEGFSNFTKSSLYIDPTTGKVVVANKVQKTLPDGTVVYEMSKNPNDFTSINSLRNRITSKYNKFNVSKSLQPGVSDLGKRIEVIMAGGVKTREDAKETEGYKKVRNTLVDSFVETNPDNVTSILTDTLAQVVDEKGNPTGESFEFTFDPEQAKSSDKYILLRENPQTGRVEGDFSTANGKKQKEMAKEFLKTKFDTMVDFEEEARQEFRPTELTASERIAQQEGEIGYGLALDITKGGQVGATALTKIKANNPSIENVYETDDTYVIQYNDGTRDNVIQKIKDKNKGELQEESAVALMAAVNPKFDVTAAQTAKERYFKGQTSTGLTKGERVGQRTKLPAQTGATYQTTTSILKKDNKNIAQEINEIAPDGDKAPQVDVIIKSIQPLPGTENIINNISVTGISSNLKKDILKISIPDEIKYVFEKYKFYKDGEVEIKYDDAEDKTELNKIVDLILKGMFDVYNAQGQPETEQAQERPASAVTETTTGTTGKGKPRTGELDPKN